MNLRDALSELSKMRVKEMQARLVQLDTMEKSIESKINEINSKKKLTSDPNKSLAALAWLNCASFASLQSHPLS